MNINELIFLVQKKNDLNRKRHRFYYYMDPNSFHNRHTVIGGAKWHRNHISKTEAKVGYKKTQQDMKNMTKMMRKARKEVGARFHWASNGSIGAVTCGELRIEHRQYKRYVDAHHIENILLRSK